MTDGRSLTSAINGRKGGRKKGLATIEREKAKDYIAKRISEYMPELFQLMMDKARTGDMPAIKELLDRGFGKAHESMDVTSGGEVLPIYNGISRHDSDQEDIQTP